MNQVHPKKLIVSKWTAVAPQNREMHFVVTLIGPEASGRVGEVDLEAVMTGNRTVIHWRELKNSDRWRIGWR